VQIEKRRDERARNAVSLEKKLDVLGMSLEKKFDVFGMLVRGESCASVSRLVGWLVGVDVSTVTMRDNENSRKRIKKDLRKILFPRSRIQWPWQPIRWLCGLRRRSAATWLLTSGFESR
jgi:hypothetical protein